MILFNPIETDYHSILFDEEGMGKIVTVLNRALNTYHDQELTELLDKIKSYQEDE